MGLLMASIADDNIQPTQLVDRLLNKVLTQGFVAQVAGNRNALAAGLLDEHDDFLRVWLFRRQIIDGSRSLSVVVCTMPLPAN